MTRALPSLSSRARRAVAGASSPALAGDVDRYEMRPRALEGLAVRLVNGAQRVILAFVACDLQPRRGVPVPRKAQRRHGRAARFPDRGEVARAAAPCVESRGRLLGEFETERVIARRRVEARRAEGPDDALGHAGRKQDGLGETQHERLRAGSVRPGKRFAAIGGDEIAAGLQIAFEPQSVHESAGLGFDSRALEGEIDERAVRLPDTQVLKRAPDRLQMERAPVFDVERIASLLKVAEFAAHGGVSRKRRAGLFDLGEWQHGDARRALRVLHLAKP